MIRVEYCPYCTKHHYRINLFVATARYGCGMRILSWGDAESPHDGYDEIR